MSDIFENDRIYEAKMKNYNDFYLRKAKIQDVRKENYMKNLLSDNAEKLYIKDQSYIKDPLLNQKELANVYHSKTPTNRMQTFKKDVDNANLLSIKNKEYLKNSGIKEKISNSVVTQKHFNDIHHQFDLHSNELKKYNQSRMNNILSVQVKEKEHMKKFKTKMNEKEKSLNKDVLNRQNYLSDNILNNNNSYSFNYHRIHGNNLYGIL